MRLTRSMLGRVGGGSTFPAAATGVDDCRPLVNVLSVHLHNESCRPGDDEIGIVRVLHHVIFCCLYGVIMNCPR